MKALFRPALMIALGACLAGALLLCRRSEKTPRKQVTMAQVFAQAYEANWESKRRMYGLSFEKLTELTRLASDGDHAAYDKVLTHLIMCGTEQEWKDVRLVLAQCQDPAVRALKPIDGKE